MNFSKWIQTAAAAVGAALGYLIGGLDSLVIALLCFVAADYITGICAAVYTKTLSSEIGFKGILKKICIFILVCIANLIDVSVIGSGSTIRTAVIFFYISNEGISLLENAVRLGLPIPDKLKSILANLEKKETE